MKRILELRAILHRHNFLYHIKGAPEITDSQFDDLMRELEQLEAKHPLKFDANSPTQRIGGAPLTGFEHFQHTVKMLSLDKVFTAAEFMTWWKQSPVAVEPKIDGLAVSLHYVFGNLLRAVTRGDGSTGDDVTMNVRTISTVPLECNKAFTGEVRGEVYMSRSRFEALNKELEAQDEELLANPRNAAAGALKSLDPKEVAKRGLSFVAYGIVDAFTPTRRYPNEQETLAVLGFQTAFGMAESQKLDPYILTKMSPTEAGFDVMTKAWGVAIQNLPVETDGLVIKYIEPKMRQELGAGTKTVKWAVAYKFPPKQVVTTLIGIELSVGRTGTVCPNAVLEPVDIEGTTVSAASLCNQDEIERLGIQPGDKVLVHKSGCIIPKVVGIHSTCDDEEGPEYGSPEAARRAWKFPTHYSDHRAGGAQAPRKLYRKPGEVAYRVEHPQACFDCVHAQLTHAASKLALDWDGCGPAQIDILMTAGVSTVLGLFERAPNETGLTGKARDKFVASREEVRRRPLWRFLRALCSDGIGSTYCKQIGALARNWRAAVAIPEWRLQELMGDVRSKAFVAALPELKFNLAELEKLGCVLDDDKLGGGGKQNLKGLVFCVTGTLSKGRDEIQALIEAAGGLTKSGVTKATNFLISGSDPGASKMKAAAKHGTPVIGEAELFEMLQK